METMEKTEQTRPAVYVCKRARVASWLMGRGFYPYRVSPDRANPLYDVFLFTATPELYEAVTEYVGSREDGLRMTLTSYQADLVARALESFAEETVRENRTAPNPDADAAIDTAEELIAYLRSRTEPARRVS